MEKKENTEGLLKAIRLFLAVMPFIIGGFHVWGSALASVFLVCCLFVIYRRNCHLFFAFDPVFTALLVLEAFLLISPFWAVDSGMAVFGFIKFLPLPLFCILLMQCKVPSPASYLAYIPYSGAVMMVVSFVLSRIPALTSFFTVFKRQAGFFQYSNTYALFLLTGACILLFKREKSIVELVVSVLLMVGVLLSGSCTVFILMGALMLVYIIWEKNKKIKISLASALVLLVLAAGGYAYFTKNYDTVGRYLTSSLSSSTFIGRFLYYRDALPVILTHPFGLGYGGYKTLQGSFQTGVYSVVHIHNDYLQMLLDAGWVPFGFSVFALIKSLRKGNAVKYAASILILVHVLFDFDLQFIAMGLILMALLRDNEKEVKSYVFTKAPELYIALVISACLSLYFGVASALGHMDKNESAVKVYPGYTDCWVEILKKTEDPQQMEVVADKILALNDSCSIANSAKARVLFSRGDVLTMEQYKLKAISLNKYSLEEYLDYIDMMRFAMELYLENGDLESASYCASRIISIPDMIDNVRQGTSPLGWKIKDQPELDLPAEYTDYIDYLLSIYGIIS